MQELMVVRTSLLLHLLQHKIETHFIDVVFHFCLTHLPLQSWYVIIVQKLLIRILHKFIFYHEFSLRTPLPPFRPIFSGSTGRNRIVVLWFLLLVIIRIILFLLLFFTRLASPPHSLAASRRLAAGLGVGTNYDLRREIGRSYWGGCWMTEWFGQLAVQYKPENI